MYCNKLKLLFYLCFNRCSFLYYYGRTNCFPLLFCVTMGWSLSNRFLNLNCQQVLFFLLLSLNTDDGVIHRNIYILKKVSADFFKSKDLQVHYYDTEKSR